MAGGRGKTETTEAERDAMLASFRKSPGNYGAAATAAGVDGRTAKRAWQVGWPRRVDAIWKKPLSVIVAEEQAAARAKMRQEPFPAGQSRDDASQQMAEEAKLVRNVSSSANAMLSLAATVFPALKLVCDQIVTDVKGGKLQGDPALAMRVLHRFASVVNHASAIAERSQAMEHLRLGTPTAILGVAPVEDGEEMTIEDYERELAAAGRAVDAAKRLGLTVLAADQTVEVAAEPGR